MISGKVKGVVNVPGGVEGEQPTAEALEEMGKKISDALQSQLQQAIMNALKQELGTDDIPDIETLQKLADEQGLLDKVKAGAQGTGENSGTDDESGK